MSQYFLFCLKLPSSQQKTETIVSSVCAYRNLQQDISSSYFSTLGAPVIADCPGFFLGLSSSFQPPIFQSSLSNFTCSYTSYQFCMSVSSGTQNQFLYIYFRFLIVNIWFFAKNFKGIIPPPKENHHYILVPFITFYSESENVFKTKNGSYNFASCFFHLLKLDACTKY